MNDLAKMFEELMAFVAVVDAGGFNAAAARFDISPSRLSRSVASLEKSLGVQLLVRTSRRFSVTEVGWRTYEDAVGLRAKLQGTAAAASDSRGEPSGTLRVLCPMALGAALVGRIAISFMAQYPRVNIVIESTDGKNRAFTAPADLAIQPSVLPLGDSSLVARCLAQFRYVIVGAPGLQHGMAKDPIPAQFTGLPALGWTFFAQPARWLLHHPRHGQHEIAVDVRFTTDNLLLIREAALAGVGAAQLPLAMCRQDIQQDRLRVLAPEWSPPQVGIYILYPSRRALTLAGRRFVEALAEGLVALERGATEAASLPG